MSLCVADMRLEDLDIMWIIYSGLCVADLGMHGDRRMAGRRAGRRAGGRLRRHTITVGRGLGLRYFRSTATTVTGRFKPKPLHHHYHIVLSECDD